MAIRTLGSWAELEVRAIIGDQLRVSRASGVRPAWTEHTLEGCDKRLPPHFATVIAPEPLVVTIICPARSWQKRAIRGSRVSQCFLYKKKRKRRRSCSGVGPVGHRELYPCEVRRGKVSMSRGVHKGGLRPSEEQSINLT